MEPSRWDDRREDCGVGVLSPRVLPLAQSGILAGVYALRGTGAAKEGGVNGQARTGTRPPVVDGRFVLGGGRAVRGGGDGAGGVRGAAAAGAATGVGHYPQRR